MQFLLNILRGEIDRVLSVLLSKKANITYLRVHPSVCKVKTPYS